MLARLLTPLGYAPFISVIFMGVFYTLGFAPVYIFPLAFLAIGALFLLVRKVKKARTAFFLGLIFGLAHNLSALYWIPQSFYITTGSVSDTLIYGGSALFILCLYLSLYTAITCYALHKVSTSFVWAPLIFTIFWVTGEIIRSVLFTGFPWNLTGYIFADIPILMQPAAWGGVYTLSAIIVYTATGLTMGRDHITIAILILAFSGYMGIWYLTKEVNETQVTKIKVRMVQPNISQIDKWEPKEQERILRKHLELSTERAHNNKTDIIIWPETAVATHFLEESQAIRKTIGNILTEKQILITGGLRRVHIGKNDEYFNSIISLNNKGKITQMYDKKHLVPFGEYIPFRNFMPKRIQKMFAAAIDYTSGVGKRTFNIKIPGKGELTALPLICFESIFPMEVAQSAAQSDFILNITNDAWFSGTIGPHQHYAMAKMRAVETGLPVLRVGNTGVTALIDPSGKEIKALRTDKTGYIDITIPKARKIRPPFLDHFSQ
jgi:apolipoprotein N-acyltransferase